MKKTRIVVKAFAGTLAATALILATATAPAQAKSDTGWGVVGNNGGYGVSALKGDTGWG